MNTARCCAVLAFTLAILTIPAAHADALLIHGLSYHSSSADPKDSCNRSEYNERNGGLGYLWEQDPELGLRYEFGGFRNSCNDTSLYAGFNLVLAGRVTTILGLATGYPRYETRLESDGSTTTKEEGGDFARLFGQLRYTPRTILPADPVIGFGPDRNFNALLTLSLQVSF